MAEAKKESKKEPKQPKGEIGWTDYRDKDGNTVCITTSKPARDFYFLYELKDGEFVKLGKATSPLELEKKYDTNKRMGRK